MKKTFKLKESNHKPANLADSIKHEVKKYIARERRKKLPENVDFWDFDCRIGLNENDAKKLHEKEINQKIVETVNSEVDSFYLEILVKPGIRKKKKSS